MLKIGSLKLHSPFILAAMAGVTDLSFRLLNRRFGAELAFVEMINVRSLGYNSKKTHKMLSTNSKDNPLGVQLLGLEPEFILRGLDILQKYEFDILDFNAACPMKKIVRRGEGAALLKNPKKLSGLLKLLVKNSSVPVTVKIRSGWDVKHVNAREVALLAQDAGIKALFIHGRTRAQIYSGQVDYRAIKEVKDALRIPVIASGNIFSAKLAKKMFDETGCDGILIARGALGNPWIFHEISGFFEKGLMLPKPQIEEVIKTMVTHLDLCIDFHGERNGVMVFRKFFIWYTRGMHSVRHFREMASRIRKKDEMVRVIEQLRKT